MLKMLMNFQRWLAFWVFFGEGKQSFNKHSFPPNYMGILVNILSHGTQIPTIWLFN